MVWFNSALFHYVCRLRTAKSILHQMQGLLGRWREIFLKCTSQMATGMLFSLEKMEQPHCCPSTESITETSSTLLRILVASRCSPYPLEEFRPTRLIEMLKQVSACVRQSQRKEGQIVHLKVVWSLII